MVESTGQCRHAICCWSLCAAQAVRQAGSVWVLWWQLCVVCVLVFTSTYPHETCDIDGSWLDFTEGLAIS